MCKIIPSLRLIIPSILLVFLLSGCELLNEEINECISKITPKLPDKNLRQGQVGVYYLETVDAFIKNADDDAFNYRFEIVKGKLPDGLVLGSEGRVFSISGTPTTEGTEEIQVRVELIDAISGPGDGFCFAKDYDREKYKIVINSRSER